MVSIVFGMAEYPIYFETHPCVVFTAEIEPDVGGIDQLIEVILGSEVVASSSDES